MRAQSTPAERVNLFFAGALSLRRLVLMEILMGMLKSDHATLFLDSVRFSDDDGAGKGCCVCWVGSVEWSLKGCGLMKMVLVFSLGLSVCWGICEFLEMYDFHWSVAVVWFVEWLYGIFLLELCEWLILDILYLYQWWMIDGFWNFVLRSKLSQ